MEYQATTSHIERTSQRSCWLCSLPNVFSTISTPIRWLSSLVIALAYWDKWYDDESRCWPSGGSSTLTWRFLINFTWCRVPFLWQRSMVMVEMIFLYAWFVACTLDRICYAGTTNLPYSSSSKEHKLAFVTAQAGILNFVRLQSPSVHGIRAFRFFPEINCSLTVRNPRSLASCTRRRREIEREI